MSETLLNKTQFFKSKDGSRDLFYQTFESSTSEPKACLLITHGQGEHSEAYRELAKYLCQTLPLKVYTWDMVGHGKSSGQRGYVGDISWLTQDFASAVDLCNQENNEHKNKQLPLFLLSHSLGALVHLYSEQENLCDFNNVKGSILSNPCVALNFTPPKWKSVGAEFLTKLAPRITLGNELKPSQMSSDPEYLEIFKKDPLRHQSISPRLYLGMLELMDSLSYRKSQHPTLTLLSPNDSVCAPLKSENYLKDSSDFLFFEKSAHEVLNDIEKKSAIDAVKEFLNENI
jgi:alpha-beta hydrolase superfamily lysophospholipase